LPLPPHSFSSAPLPDPARYASDAAQAIGAQFEDLDHGGGYLFRISKGDRFVLAGAGALCAYPVNAATAFTIARDKAHTKSVLAAASLPIIRGGLFFAHDRRIALRGPGREAADACAFATSLGYPVFCKPNLGSRGNFAEIIGGDAALLDYAARIAAEFEAFLVEPLLDGEEHRVLVFDGRPVFHSAKTAPALVGDGGSTLTELLEMLNERLARDLISPTPQSALAGYDLARVLARGERLPLPGRRNLGAAGSLEHVSMHAPQPLADLAIAAVAAMGLRLGAVDIFDVSSQRDLSSLVIIEINANPGLKTLELAGRHDVIQSLWIAILQDQLGG
jgi:glutathione synthase/RimK-type ligase-like ATP-grasp enzyme